MPAQVGTVAVSVDNVDNLVCLCRPEHFPDGVKFIGSCQPVRVSPGPIVGPAALFPEGWPPPPPAGGGDQPQFTVRHSPLDTLNPLPPVHTGQPLLLSHRCFPSCPLD